MDRLLDFTSLLSIGLIVLVLGSIRRAHIRVEYSVSWLAGAVALLVVSRSPGLIERTAALVGVSYPPLALMLVAGCFFLLVLYRFSVIISKLRDDNVALAQRVAILEYYLRSGRQILP